MPTPGLAFHETMQIGHRRARRPHVPRRLWDWRVANNGNRFRKHPERAPYGQPVEWKSKIATTIFGTMWELIQPLDKDDLFGRFLAERGGVGGVHHIAVITPDFRRVVQEQAARGNEPILSGTFSGVEVHYLSTERELGVILEVFSGFPEGIEKPGAKSKKATG